MTLVATSAATAQRIDAAWPGQRPPEDHHHVWRWATLLGECRDSFTLVTEGAGEPAAVYGSRHATPLNLASRLFYRMDYFEVAPKLRGTGVGVLMLGVMALRAREAGAVGIVGAAFNVPKLLAFYRAAGAVLECPRGWNAPPGVVAFHIDESALTRLEAIVHAQRDEPG